MQAKAMPTISYPEQAELYPLYLAMRDLIRVRRRWRSGLTPRAEVRKAALTVRESANAVVQRF